MVILLTTSVLFLSLIAIGIYFWQKPAKPQTIPSPPAVPPRGLFSDTRAVEEPSVSADNEHQGLLSRAEEGNMKVLLEAQNLSIYPEALTALVIQAVTEPKLLSLASYVKQNNLPVNKALADAMLRSWEGAPSRQSTPKMLHFAALANDAEVYRKAVETALTYWRNGKLSDISALELQALFNGEFWVLSSEVRNSGNGFILKRTLSSARRELEGTTKSE
ncbi:MAG TPA: hypothetical protein VI306_07650 [Pyrinomonadaceae bacterium]